ncbi:hypothetical protein BKA61DRAFT_635531 [Leptodontidium sp. MPI-SDFR-AT-0119]|nr:hypothetical protein BKA61DRAFT_635531 [Leptodontidium sp. MPI-SDFR-AT-0119]
MTSFLSSGITSMVYLDSSSDTVIKYPHQEEEEPAIEVERRIYERFQQHGGHEGLLRYHGTFGPGIRLEYASNNGPRQYIETHEIDTKQCIQWAQQVTRALAFVHSMNVLLDFSASSLDGSNPCVVVTASHKCPGDDLKSTQADLFALGSTLYEILTGKPPYYGLFKQSKFPETKSLGPIGDVITGCWQGRFGSANDVLEAINSCVRTCSIAPSTLETTMAVSVLGLAQPLRG